MRSMLLCSRSALMLLILTMPILFVGCGRDETGLTGPSDVSLVPVQEEQQGSMVQRGISLDQAEQWMEELSMGLASVLGEESVRAVLRRELDAAEKHEIPVAEFVSAGLEISGSTVLDLMASRTNATPKEIMNIIEVMPTLEISLPVHYDDWSGGELVVAVSPPRDENMVTEIVAYDALGNRLTLSSRQAPASPTLVMALDEDSQSWKKPGALMTSEHDSTNDPKEHQGDYKIFIDALQMIIYDDHEPWWRGDPEIYTAVFQVGDVFWSGTQFRDVNREDWMYLFDPFVLIYERIVDHIPLMKVMIYEADSPDADDLVAEWEGIWPNGYTWYYGSDADIRLTSTICTGW